MVVPKRIVTAAEYFEAEAASETRHEYFYGDLFAMAGGTDRHNLICQNITIALRQKLRGGACSVFMENVKLELAADAHYTYPDVMITCDARDKVDPLAKRYPTILFEVLSVSTESYDRGKKSMFYRRLPSLREYVLVSQDSVSIEHFFRNDNGTWTLTEYVSLDDALTLPSLDLTLPLRALYDEIEFTPTASPQ